MGRKVTAATTITFIVVPAKHPDDFESMYIDQRRRDSAGWDTFPVRSGRLLWTFLAKATNLDLGVFGCADRKDRDDRRVTLRTRLLTHGAALDAIPVLKKLVGKGADATALALQKHGGGRASLARIKKALETGKWPANGDPAEEAAAFTRQLLIQCERAKAWKFDPDMGVCWEYRGRVKV